MEKERVSTNLVRGITFYLCFGKFASPRVEFNRKYVYFRIVLGYISFSIMKYDIEALIEKLSDKLDTLKKETLWNVES